MRMSVVSSTNTSVSVVASARSQVAGGSSFTLFIAHSTHVPTNLLVGRVSVSTTGGVGGSGSGSGRLHAANRANAANAATHSIPQECLVIFIVCVLFFLIVVESKGYEFFRQNYIFCGCRGE